MRSRDQFAAARAALADFAAVGRFGWGAPVPATTLAAELGLSPTPVREALAHLAGEGILHRSPGRGYFAPSPSASDIVELYQLHRILISAILDDLFPWVSRPGMRARSGGADPVEAVFLALAAASSSGRLAQEHARATAMLRPIRSAEAVVCPVSSTMVQSLVRALEGGELKSLETEIEHYHRDRIDQAEITLSALRRFSRSIDQI